MLDQHRVLAHIRASKAPKPGTRILVEGGGSVEMLQRHDALFELAFAEPVLPLLERVGRMPLPPYIDRPDDAADRERYQTVYAQRAGAWRPRPPACTSMRALLEAIRAKGWIPPSLPLHVGAGTFQPVRVERIEDHVMHREWLEVGQDVVDAVSASPGPRRPGSRRRHHQRALAGSAARDGELKPFSGDTDIFIYPGRPFHVVDALVTNLHLPESTLLMLVSAFAGYPETMAAYDAAGGAGAILFSYGDAMFITRNPRPNGPRTDP